MKNTGEILKLIDHESIIYGMGAGLFLGIISSYLLNSPVYVFLGIYSGLTAGIVDCYMKSVKEIKSFLLKNQQLLKHTKQIN